MFSTYCSNVFIVIFVLLTLSTNVGLSVEDCVITKKLGQYYSRNASNSYGKLLNTSESKNEQDCREKCCDSELCNLMMYSTVLKEEGSSNVTCFLFNCHEISRCIMKELPKNITGESTIGIKQANVTENKSSVSSHTEQPDYTTETVVLSTIPTFSGSSNVSGILVAGSSLENHQASKSSHLPTASHTPKGGRKTRRKFSERKSHTTPVSLVLSLIFGILFFGTVVFLIGRRWSETCFRRGYSRVDYLLNDYD